jgi:hypothetical protein
MESGQLQFWFMLFMWVIYGVILLVKKEKISVKAIYGNYWIPLMTLIKQSSVIVTVLTGWIVFKEKNILYKLICAGIVTIGILIPLILK